VKLHLITAEAPAIRRDTQPLTGRDHAPPQSCRAADAPAETAIADAAKRDRPALAPAAGMASFEEHRAYLLRCRPRPLQVSLPEDRLRSLDLYILSWRDACARAVSGPDAAGTRLLCWPVEEMMNSFLGVVLSMVLAFVWPVARHP